MVEEMVLQEIEGNGDIAVWEDRKTLLFLRIRNSFAANMQS
mgnify:CR=1 FL=1